jgi:hypothetical protein
MDERGTVAEMVAEEEKTQSDLNPILRSNAFCGSDAFFLSFSFRWQHTY